MKNRTKKTVKRIIVAALVLFTVSAVIENREKITASFSRISSSVMTGKSEDVTDDGMKRLLDIYLEYEKSNANTN